MNKRVRVVLWVFGVTFVIGCIVKWLSSYTGGDKYLMLSFLTLLGLSLMQFWGENK